MLIKDGTIHFVVHLVDAFLEMILTVFRSRFPCLNELSVSLAEDRSWSELEEFEKEYEKANYQPDIQNTLRDSLRDSYQQGVPSMHYFALETSTTLA
ncbi:hypothetical protein Tco_1543989 [Tanacetum coccineum]